MSNEVVKSNKEKASTAMSVKGMFEKNHKALLPALAKGVNYERFVRVVVNAISTTPALDGCTASSLFMSTVKGFTMGLEVNGALGEAYLVPFRNNKKGVMEAQFQPSYKGLIKLARQSGDITLVYADCIKTNDKYKISRGTDPKLEHEYDLGNRGEAKGYYAVFKLKDGSTDFEFMTIKEIDSIKERSKAWQNFISKGYECPWNTDYDEMAKKTVLKRLLKRAPMSVENHALFEAVNADNKVAMGESTSDVSDFIDVEGLEVTQDEPRVSKFEKLTQESEDKIPMEAKKEEVKTLESMLEKAPVTLEEIKAMLKEHGEEFNESEVKAHLKTYVNKTLNWKDSK